jgi:hypothetical protein
MEMKFQNINPTTLPLSQRQNIDYNAMNNNKKNTPPPVSDIDLAQYIIKTKEKNSLNYFPPYDLLLNKHKIKNLEQNNKKDILDRIEKVKTDFYHKNLNSDALLPKKYDGNTSSDSLFSFIIDLRLYLKDNPDAEEIKEILELFLESYTFIVEAEVISRIKNSDSKIAHRQKFTEKFKKKLETLQEGERFVYSPGIQGHCILTEYTCRFVDGKKLFDVKIINSGDGLEHHKSKSFLSFLNPKAKYQTYLLKGVEANAIIKGNFIDKILEKQLPTPARGADIPLLGRLIKAFDAVKRSLTSVSGIYKIVKKDLVKNGGGRIIVSNDPRLHHKPQKKGICTRKVYSYWLKENLSHQVLVEDFKLKTSKKSLVRLKASNELEREINNRKIEKNSASFKLLVKPHWFSKIIMNLRNKMDTETMILIGEKTLARREKKLQQAIEAFHKQKSESPRTIDFSEDSLFCSFNK